MQTSRKMYELRKECTDLVYVEYFCKIDAEYAIEGAGSGGAKLDGPGRIGPGRAGPGRRWFTW